jgi:NAD(P)-dependent dehydrogenase (short-subunit alcohol dehydrogenase family)
MWEFEPMNLDHARVAITGGSGGIGRALAAAFQATGCSVQSLDLPGRGADLAADVTDRNATAAAFVSIGELDILIANAGGGVAGLASDLDDSKWDQPSMSTSAAP